jgi:Fur family ferric uptake transcriptional regulator
MAAPAKAEAKNGFLAFLASKKLRLTQQRRVIIDTAFGTAEHFTAEQLLAWSQSRDQSVSRATVYRTLPLLVESGLIQQLDLGKNETIYDPNYTDHPAHSHIVCRDCNKIVEFESNQLAEIESQIQNNLGFHVESVRVQVTASCDEFRRLGFCPYKQPCRP